MRRWLGIAVALAGCGRISFEDHAPDDASTDGAALAPCTAWGTFGPSTRLAAIATPYNDWAPGVTRDGAELAFSAWDGPSAQFNIASAHRVVDGFADPVVLAGLDLQNRWEMEPSFNANATAIYFTSRSSGDRFRIERSARIDATTFAPSVIVEDSANYNHDAEPSGDELRLYYVTNNLPPTNGHLQIVVAERTTTAEPFGAPSVITDLESTSDQESPTLSPDELEMFFTSNRSGGAEYDIWRATRSAIGQPWTAPTRVIELSTTRDDIGPYLSADGATIYYNRDVLRGGGADGDIWAATRPCLGR